MVEESALSRLIAHHLRGNIWQGQDGVDSGRKGMIPVRTGLIPDILG